MNGFAVQTYALVALILIAALAVGRAICLAAGGRRRWWAAPLVGLAALMVLAGITVRLPGDAVTAAVFVLVATAVALVFLARAGSLRLHGGDVATAAIALAGASIPFLASGRVGLPGVGLDDDMANHLLFAEGLRSARMTSLYGGIGDYPPGPHSLVAALGTATGVSLDRVFTALMVATVALIALSAAGALAREGWWRRAAVGVAAALFYLMAAYYAEGSFKEPMMGGFLLALVLHLEQVRARGTLRSLRALLPAVALVAGSIYVYSYVALAWIAIALAIWAAAEAIRRPSPRVWRRNGRGLVVPVVAGIVLVAVLVAPIGGEVLQFFHSIRFSPAGTGAVSAAHNPGNLAHSLSAYEAFGLWLSGDFRFAPGNAFHTGELALFGLGVLAFGLLWSLRSRRLLLPAAAAACAIVYWRVNGRETPYFVAKALVIAGPVVVALSLRGLLERGVERGGHGIWMPRLRALVGVGFLVAAGWSSQLALRNEPVGAPAQVAELNAMRAAIGRQSVLFLGDDDFAPWELRGAAMSALAPSTVSLGRATARPNKPFVYGAQIDFDSVDAATLNRFDWVVLPNTPFASVPPAGFDLARSSRLFQLWHRTGTVQPRQVIEPSGQPGAVLDCHTRAGRRLRDTPGVASVIPSPHLFSASPVLLGTAASYILPLPAGRWTLSLNYTSDTDVRASVAGQGRWTMPAYDGRGGLYFRVGTVVSRGAPLRLTLRGDRPSAFTGHLFAANYGGIAATRAPLHASLVPLRQACGRYVDWYRTS